MYQVKCRPISTGRPFGEAETVFSHVEYGPIPHRITVFTRTHHLIIKEKSFNFLYQDSRLAINKGGNA